MAWVLMQMLRYKVVYHYSKGRRNITDCDGENHLQIILSILVLFTYCIIVVNYTTEDIIFTRIAVLRMLLR